MKTLFFSIFFLGISTMIYSQCTNTFQYPFDPVFAPMFAEDTMIISDAQYAGDFVIIESLSIGETYELDIDTLGHYITVRDAYDHSVTLAHGPSPLSYTPAASDVISVHINLISPPCGTNNNLRISTILCLTCPSIPPAVGVNTTEPEATFEVNGEILLGNSIRPAKAGMVRWNDIVNDFEGYNGVNWISLTKSNSNSWGTAPVNVVQEDQKIVASDGNSNERFGTSVSINGDYAIVGESLFASGNNYQSAAYIYHRSEGIWTEQAKLTPSDGFIGDNFGSAVAIDGDFVVVGARGDNSDQGAAYVFQRSGSLWEEQVKLTAMDGHSDDEFGVGVGIEGEHIIVGAFNLDNGAINDQGAAYIFERNGISWTQEAKLLDPLGSYNDFFGFRVDIDGNYAIVGSFTEQVAIIYNKVGTTWSQQIRLTSSNPDPGAFDDYGYSVAIDGNFAVVGEPGDLDNEGVVYVYERFGTDWLEHSVLTADVGNPLSEFGELVDIDGDFILVGDIKASVGNNENQGAAYIFQLNGGIWEQQAKLTSSDGNVGDYCGRVAIDGNFVIVGARYQDPGGAAHIFQKK